MFAVTDPAERSKYNLSASFDDFPNRTITVGTKQFTGWIISFAEAKSNGGYYSPGPQMHNKFAIIDDKWVFTGSWNFTVTGLYGSESNMQQGILGGNQQHVVEINSPALARIYTTEFNEMWGSDTMTPSIISSNFHGRKTDNTGHIVNVGGQPVEIYFSPGDDAIGKARETISFEADHSAFFTIFAWSDQGMVDELKLKWEGSKQDQTVSRTGFEVRGVFDSWFWNQCWSAAIDMTGRTLSSACGNNPNTRWNNSAPVFIDAETRKLHSKTIIIDADTASEPTVIVGSTNFSNNGNNINDENMLIIHDARVANQFLQEFNARYMAAGGEIYPQ
jgi:phosphatidylserine/phosphatidylglycerophosphate/cardiolipin synthase-like enzyme